MSYAWTYRELLTSDTQFPSSFIICLSYYSGLSGVNHKIKDEMPVQEPSLSDCICIYEPPSCLLYSRSSFVIFIKFFTNFKFQIKWPPSTLGGFLFVRKGFKRQSLS